MIGWTEVVTPRVQSFSQQGLSLPTGRDIKTRQVSQSWRDVQLGSEVGFGEGWKRLGTKKNQGNVDATDIREITVPEMPFFAQKVTMVGGQNCHLILEIPFFPE